MKVSVCDSRMQVVEEESADSRLGASFRRTRPDPESDLIESFLKDTPLTIPKGGWDDDCDPMRYNGPGWREVLAEILTTPDNLLCHNAY